MESHYRWLRLIVQMACTVLEQMGTYPRDRAPILFMMEEFATLGHMEIMERAAAYFPGFGVKLWAVLQDTTQLRRYYQTAGRPSSAMPAWCSASPMAISRRSTTSRSASRS